MNASLQHRGPVVLTAGRSTAPQNAYGTVRFFVVLATRAGLRWLGVASKPRVDGLTRSTPLVRPPTGLARGPWPPEQPLPVRTKSDQPEAWFRGDGWGGRWGMKSAAAAQKKPAEAGLSDRPEDSGLVAPAKSQTQQRQADQGDRRWLRNH